MDIVYFDSIDGRYYYKLTSNVDSKAIHIGKDFNTMTVMLSSVTGGSCKVQYSLGSKTSIEDNSAIWYDWSKGDVSSEGGLTFDAPVSYLRVIANGATYTMEVLA